MRLRFCILKLRGDMLDEGELHFVEAAQTLDAAKANGASALESLLKRLADVPTPGGPTRLQLSDSSRSESLSR